MDSERKRRDGDIGEDKEINNVKVEFKIPVPEFIDPVFTKTSPKRSFSVIQNERFGLVFAKTGSIILGTAQIYWRNDAPGTIGDGDRICHVYNLHILYISRIFLLPCIRASPIY
jgi:hypothetical protein